jgi:hypothetical protein
VDNDLQQIERLDADIRTAQAGIEKFITLAGVVAAAIVTVGLAAKDQQPLVAILAPYALAILITYLLQLYTDVEVRWIIREYHEVSLYKSNNGQPIALQPAVLTVRYRNRLSVRLISVLYAIGYAGAIFGSVIQAHIDLPPFWETVHYIMLTLSLGVVGRAAWELFHARHTANESIKSAKTYFASLEKEETPDSIQAQLSQPADHHIS